MSLDCTRGFITSDIKSRPIETENAKNSVKLFQSFKGIGASASKPGFGAGAGVFGRVSGGAIDKYSGGKFGSKNLFKSEKTDDIKNFLSPIGIAKPQIPKNDTKIAPKKLQKPTAKAKPQPFKELGKSLFSFIENSNYSLVHPNVSGNGKVAKHLDFLA